MHYNGVNSYIFAKHVETCKFNEKDSGITEAPLCLDTVSKKILVDDIKKIGWYGYVCEFSVDYDSIDVDDILPIHK